MSLPAERRRHTRYETELQGRIGPPGEALADCLIRDYCSGGMLIELPRGPYGEAPPAFATGQALELRLELLTAQGPRRVRLDATTAWVANDCLGLSFARVSGAIVNALRLHDGLLHGGGPRPLQADPPTADIRCLAGLREAAEGLLPGLLGEILTKAGEDLRDLLERGTSDRERQQIDRDIRALGPQRSADPLLQSILSMAIEGCAAEPVQTDGLGPDEGDPDDFAAWLEASRVCSLLERLHMPQLGALASRLGAAQYAEVRGIPAVPFEPHHFTAAIQALARRQHLGVTSRAVLLDRAGRLLQDRLGAFYAGLHGALDALGVAGAQVENKVALLRPSNGPWCPGPASAGTASDALPAQSVGSGAGLRCAMGAEQLEGLLALEARQRGHQARELVDLVGGLPDMAPGIGVWLAPLQGLLVREAVAERSFFHDSGHPLWAIFDHLGHLQMFHRGPDPGAAEDPLQQRVAELLKPLDYPGVEARTLRVVAESLGRLTAEHSRLYQRNAERVVEASEIRDRVRRVRKAVVTELNRRYRGRQVPALVPDLLEAGWRAALQTALLGGADGGEHYAGLLRLLDALVGHLGGDAFEDPALHLQAAQLPTAIARELARVAFDPFRRDRIGARLRAELSGPRPQGPALLRMPPLVEEAEEASAATPPAGVSESAWQHALERCAGVRVGDRLRLLEGTERGQGLRVAWIRIDREAFTLVDYRGLRARDITLFDLALGLHRRRIELDAVDGRALSDRAVEALLSRMAARLVQQTVLDSLTGLITRQQFEAALGKALAVPGRSGDIGVMLWIDIDRFRLINEACGYDTGDRLLIAVARRLEQVRGVRLLAHLGGDRFAALLPDLPLVDGERRAREICDGLRGLSFDWPGQTMALSASIGVVGLAAANDGIAGLLDAAEASLAQAKSAGGDQACTYSGDAPAVAQRREVVQWVVRVDEALEHGELKLRCQPIVPVRPNEGLVPHYEILLGVRSGTAEALPIAEFIEAAESHDRMRAVDRWVVGTTLQWIGAHRHQMPVLHGFSVNLSAQTAADPGFVDFVRQQFQRTRVDPAWLSFEITERAVVADLPRTAGMIRELKAMGCRVALDDFGSGAASYAYLRDLPVDWLKIDGALVRKIAGAEDDLAVVRSINEIGHFLGKQTIAEYVADDAILRRVREIGVDFAQGYGISPPLLLDDLVRPRLADDSEGEAFPGPVQADRRNHQ